VVAVAVGVGVAVVVGVGVAVGVAVVVVVEVGSDQMKDMNAVMSLFGVFWVIALR